MKAVYINIHLTGRALKRIGGKASGPPGYYRTDKTVFFSAFYYHGFYNFSDIIVFRWWFKADGLKGVLKPFKVWFHPEYPVVDTPHHVKYPISPVDQVVIHRKDHKRWVCDISLYHSGIHCQVIVLPEFFFRIKVAEKVFPCNKSQVYVHIFTRVQTPCKW